MTSSKGNRQAMSYYSGKFEWGLISKEVKTHYFHLDLIASGSSFMIENNVDDAERNEKLEGRWKVIKEETQEEVAENIKTTSDAYSKDSPYRVVLYLPNGKEIKLQFIEKKRESLQISLKTNIDLTDLDIKRKTSIILIGKSCKMNNGTLSTPGTNDEEDEEDSSDDEDDQPTHRRSKTYYVLRKWLIRLLLICVALYFIAAAVTLFPPVWARVWKYLLGDAKYLEMVKIHTPDAHVDPEYYLRRIRSDIMNKRPV